MAGRAVTLVLQGAEPLLGLSVQLLQVRRPSAGEEDIVLVLVPRGPRPLAGPNTQTLVALSLG